MPLIRTENALSAASAHIASIPDADINKYLISSYLAKVSAVIFYAEMEELVKKVVEERIKVALDQRVSMFVVKTNEGILKRMKRRELSDTVALFGDDCRAKFIEMFPEEKMSIYGNVIRKRHEASHGPDTNVTLKEVEDAVAVGKAIITALPKIIA